MSNAISFDAAMQRIFGNVLDKKDILEESNALIEVIKSNPDYGKDNENGHNLNDRLAFINTICLAMQENL